MANEASSTTQSKLWKPSVIGAIIAGCLAGVIGFVIVNQFHPFTVFDPNLPDMGPYPSGELLAQHNAEMVRVYSYNCAAGVSIVAAIAGAILGLFGSHRQKLIAAVVAAVVGGLVGGGAGYLAGQLAAKDIVAGTQQSLGKVAAYQAAIWGLAGCSICAVLAGFNDRRQLVTAAIFGLVGGVVGSLLFVIIASIVWPAINLSVLAPQLTAQRAAWIIPPTIAICLLFAIGVRNNAPKESAVSAGEVAG